MPNISLQDTNSNTITTEQLLGSILPTNGYLSLQYYLSIVAGMTNVLVIPFPSFADYPLPISNMNIIKRNNKAELQIVEVVKEDTDAVAAQIYPRDKFYRIDNSGATPAYTAYDTGNITLMQLSTDEFVLIGNYPYPGAYFEIDTAGNYTGLTFKYWNGTAKVSMPAGFSDGTSGFTVSGYIAFKNSSLVRRKNINGVYGFPLLYITCTGVTTPAVASAGYFANVFELPKCFIAGKITSYWKKNGGYNTAADPDLALYNRGLVAYETSPLSAGESLACEYSYKLPQPKEYDLVFSPSIGGEAARGWYASTAYSNDDIMIVESSVTPGSYNSYVVTSSGTSGTTSPTADMAAGDETVTDGGVTWTNAGYDLFSSYWFVRVDDGDPISIIYDGVTANKEIIPGCEIYLSVNIFPCQVPLAIKDDLKFLHIANAYTSENIIYNGDINLGSFSYDANAELAIHIIPEIGEDETNNDRVFEMWAVQNTYGLTGANE